MSRNLSLKQVVLQDFIILAKHWITCYKNTLWVFTDLKGLLKLESLWLVAYLRLFAFKWTMSLDSNIMNMDKMLKIKIRKVQDLVLSGKFEWVSKCFLQNQEYFNYKRRVVDIPIISNYLVQEVLKMILEPIFEMQFRSTNHGFRLERNYLTALVDLKRRFKDVIWFIEGDLKQNVINLDIGSLMLVIKTRITDFNILKLIKTGLYLKIFSQDIMTGVSSCIRNLSSGLLKPLLVNIYLHSFDLFMEDLYFEYLGFIKVNKRSINQERFKFLRVSQKKEIDNRFSMYFNFKKEYSVVKYIRYATVFLVGIIGSRSLVYKIRQQIQEFFYKNLKIMLKVNKLSIVHISKTISFLGFVFGRRYIYIKQKYVGTLVKRRKALLTLDVSFRKLILWLSEKGFCDKQGKPKPLFYYLKYSQAVTNVYMNRILRSFCEWCKIAGNRKRVVALVSYIIRYSVAKLYATKFKLSSVAQVFKRGGNNLGKLIGHKKRVSFRSFFNQSVVRNEEKFLNNKWDKSDQMQGLLYDRSFKIPKPEKITKLQVVKPLYVMLLENFDSIEKLVVYLKEEKIRSGQKELLLRTF